MRTATVCMTCKEKAQPVYLGRIKGITNGKNKTRSLTKRAGSKVLKCYYCMKHGFFFQATANKKRKTIEEDE